MKRFLPILCIFFFALVSCEKDEPTIPGDTEQTLFMYMPWSTNLLNEFYVNISALETAISKRGLSNEQVLVFLQTSQTEATLFEIIYNKGTCYRETLKEYTNPAVTTARGITSILKDVIGHAPAKRYGMVVSCHGMSWLPVGSTKASRVSEEIAVGSDAGLKTRYFGSLNSEPEFQTEICDFVDGVKNAGIRLEYLLFDDCYMSSIEVAYDFREITDHLVASPCEVMAYGMPYDVIGEYMLGEVDYEGICNGILSFYQGYRYPYVTIAMTVCAELEALAEVMREINEAYEFDSSLLRSVQRLDGYSPICFFDFSDYVSKLCPDEELLQRFEAQFERSVPSNCRRATDYFYTNSSGSIKLNTYSGMTISDPSVSSWTSTKQETNWYKATH